jgi:hypothetical protein
MAIEKETFQNRLEKNFDTKSIKKPSRPSGSIDRELDEAQLLSEEIAERRIWIEDMIKMGHGEKYRKQIQFEINEVNFVFIQEISQVGSDTEKFRSISSVVLY